MMLVHRHPSRTSSLTKAILLVLLCVLLNLSAGLSVSRTLTRIVHLHSGKVQGVVVSHKSLPSVEVFLGVPYATPPTGANRFSPTRSVPPWAGVRLCDHLAPVCPQPPLNLNVTLSRGKLAALRRLAPFLRPYDEDCLYLNVYAPAPSSEDGWSGPGRLPVLVFLHGGDDFSRGGGNPWDGGVLAAHGNLVVLTLNYRLGALGFLNLNSHPESRPRVANSGLMDQIAALHWVQQNIRQFGGDPGRVTLAGHGPGAACVHFLAVSPALTPGLFHRVILMSGSALSPWAAVEDPVLSASSLAHQVNCSGHVDVTGCLQEVSVDDILSADLTPAAFLNALGPSVDGVVIRPDYRSHHTPPVRELDVLFGVVTSEALGQFSATDLQAGFDGTRRDRIIRTYVRNAYEYHLPEIFVTVVNEYTDWERTVVHPVNTRDATVAALSDAQFVAPVVSAGDFFSGGKASGKHAFFYVFDHQSKYGDYPQRVGTAHGEELPYLFGAPLVDSLGHFPHNFTRPEAALSEAFMTSVANFIKTGNPNFVDTHDHFLPVSKEKNRLRMIKWDQYDPVHQKYLEISLRPKMKHHFRSHQLSVWLRLVPELHRAGREDAHSRHPHDRFQENQESELYLGPVRPFPRKENATVAEVILPITTMETMVTTCVNLYATRSHGNSSADQVAITTPLALSPMLQLTVAVGLSLLLLNLLIFAGVCYQREKTRLEMKMLEKERRERADAGVKRSASVVLDMDESPLSVLTPLPPKLGPKRALLGQFFKNPAPREYNNSGIPPPPSPPRSSLRKNSLPTAAISEITV